jgi:predicted metal-dependent phosphoesterase TrpH
MAGKHRKNRKTKLKHSVGRKGISNFAKIEKLEGVKAVIPARTIANRKSGGKDIEYVKREETCIIVNVLDKNVYRESRVVWEAGCADIVDRQLRDMDRQRTVPQELSAITNLHLHSIYSDGALSPEELLEKLIDASREAGRKLTSFALTDHNTFNGIEPMLRAIEANKDASDLMFIPGVEVSSQYDSLEVHVLGYFPDLIKDGKLNEGRVIAIKEYLEPMFDKVISHTISAVANDFLPRFVDFVLRRYEELTGICHTIDINDIRNYYLNQEQIAREKSLPHEKDHNDVFCGKHPKVTRHFIYHYINKVTKEENGNGGIPIELLKCYCDRGSKPDVVAGWYMNLQDWTKIEDYGEKMKRCDELKKIAHEDTGFMWAQQFTEQHLPTPEEVVEAISRAGGVPVIAHPSELIYKFGGNDDAHGRAEFESFLSERLINAGLMGLEVVHYTHSKGLTRYLEEICDRYGLLKTGGSDFHSKARNHHLLFPRRGIFVPDKYAQEINELFH